MNKLAYIFVPNQFVIGHVFLKLLIKRLAVAMVNKTVDNYYKMLQASEPVYAETVSGEYPFLLLYMQCIQVSHT
jgi:hypothetical protein